MALVAVGMLPATAAAFDAGVAVKDITPPLAGAADPSGFVVCAAFTGPRTWAFDEPYADVNANGRYDDPEPYCDANVNLRHDQIWYSGADIGAPLPATKVHDPITARAFAIRQDAKTLVVVSVAAQGLFNTYIDRAISRAKALDPAITDMVVSANHNESSPDTIGIYGGPAVAETLPLRTGIDDYYMDFLVEQIAQAADAAVETLAPATVHVRQAAPPAGVEVRLSDNWPTTDNGSDKPVAIDPKLGVIQARAAGSGDPIFTVLSLAAHNQEIGHSDDPALAGDISADWPGWFEARVAAGGGGTGIYLVGDNGSEEDPITAPEQGGEGSYQQAQATGEALGDVTLATASGAGPIAPGPIHSARHDFCVPLENNLFKAAAAAGLFGDRETYVVQGGQCVPAATVPDGLQTTVGLVDVGPELQLILNPGEAFPALMLGSRWGFEDVPVECQGRANPPVPTWLSHARHRLQVGLANDFIGYLIPPWAYIGQAGAIATTTDPDCNSGGGSDDSAGHHHKLETEGVGPTASDLVARNATQLQLDDAPDPTAAVVPGRFVLTDGTLSRSPLGATGVRLADGSTLTGQFIDYDGATQAAPDLTTRGILTTRPGCAILEQRVYVDVFPPFPAPPAARRARAGCGPPPNYPLPCAPHRRPELRVTRAVVRRHRLRVRGTARARHCGKGLRKVTVRYRGRTHRAKGRTRWHFRARVRRVRRVVVVAIDRSGRRTRRVVRVRRG
ncbi:MAG: hypothetical protein QOI80_148 [Solirubrobacteraceae bacterium]|nr:hypothetical protein [Solirubrobacteraceae bacterium]